MIKLICFLLLIDLIVLNNFNLFVIIDFMNQNIAIQVPKFFSQIHFIITRSSLFKINNFDKIIKVNKSFQLLPCFQILIN